MRNLRKLPVSINFKLCFIIIKFILKFYFLNSAQEENVFKFNDSDDMQNLESCIGLKV